MKEARPRTITCAVARVDTKAVLDARWKEWSGGLLFFYG